MTLTGYSVVIGETSQELTAKERIRIKDTADAVKLDEATENGAIVINPAMYAVLNIHNEKSDNVDYKNYIVIDKDGTKYVTGSESFWSSFINIYEEMDGEQEEWAVKAYKLPSKNYKGKDFITCSIQ
jgi:hypothetical protein